MGPQLSAYLIALTDGFHRFTDPRELACHAGVAPFERSSGSSVRGRTRVSHQANKTLKTMLHMAALANVQRAGELKTYFQRKVAEGKKPILVVNAVRNKILHRVCAVIRRGQPFVPHLTSTTATEKHLQTLVSYPSFPPPPLPSLPLGGHRIMLVCLSPGNFRGFRLVGLSAFGFLAFGFRLSSACRLCRLCRPMGRLCLVYVGLSPLSETSHLTHRSRMGSRRLASTNTDALLMGKGRNQPTCCDEHE